MPSKKSASILRRALASAENHIHSKHGPLLSRFRAGLLKWLYASRFILLESGTFLRRPEDREFKDHVSWRLGIIHADIAALAREQAASQYKSTKFVADRIHALNERAPIVQTSKSLESELEHLVIRRHHRKSDTVVFNAALGESYRRQVAQALLSHESYAALHRYDYVSLQATNHNSRPAPWYKIALAAKMLRLGYKYLLFLDADCLITNYRCDFPSLTKPFSGPNDDACFYLAEDEGGINTGVLLMQSTPELAVILDLIWNNTAFVHHNNWEQQALKDLLSEFPSLQNFFRIVRGTRTINTFPTERLQLVGNLNFQSNTWQPGDFLCHFSGIRGPVLKRLISQYFAKYPPPSALKKITEHET